MHTEIGSSLFPRLRDSPLGAGVESRNLGKDFSRSLYKSEISFTSIGNPSVEGFRVFMGLDILDRNSSAGGFGNPCSLRIRIPKKKFENPDSGIPQLEDSGNPSVYGIGRCIRLTAQTLFSTTSPPADLAGTLRCRTCRVTLTPSEDKRPRMTRLQKRPMMKLEQEKNK